MPDPYSPTAPYFDTSLAMPACVFALWTFSSENILSVVGFVGFVNTRGSYLGQQVAVVVVSTAGFRA